MKLQLNFVPDKPTEAGRIYLMKDLKEIFTKKDIPVTAFPGRNGGVDLKSVIGFANLTEINCDKIEFEVKPLKQDILDIVKDKKLTITAFGNVDPITKVVKDIHLTSLYVVYK